jgi:quinolinate synthase
LYWQPPLPPRYTTMTTDQLAAVVAARKAQLGRQLVILGHHYQQDEVIQFADFTGDSFKLSQLAAQRVREVGAKYVIFAGVHFMAESADVLTPEGTVVILPDLSAGCSMADMAHFDDTVEAWDLIQQTLAGPSPRLAGKSRSSKPLSPRERMSASSPTGEGVFAAPSIRIIPICYMNSTAAIKAFCGERGGAVCTSSNCQRVFEWALAGGTQPRRKGEAIKILFIPDQHLGRNTAAAMGYDVARDMCVWDPRDEAGTGLGGNSAEDLARATFILWKGHCSVHKLFRPEHVDQARAAWPDVKVIVHPECVREVVEKADLTGSTEGILKTVLAAKPGSRWAVGTEVHMVNRLAREAAERGIKVRMLSECQCLCTTMYRIDLPHLLWALDNLAEGKVVNQIKVDPAVRQWALVALNRMLELTASPPPDAPDAPAAAANTLATSAAD